MNNVISRIVHDIHYLNDVKYSGLNNCTFIGNTGYLYKIYQSDLLVPQGSS